MEHLSERTRKIANEFVENVRQCFGEELLSVILYGPAARGEEIKGSTAVNFMVVVRDNTPSELAPCSSFVKSWERHGITAPLFITPEYIRDSLDSFPLEFMEMKSSYSVITGADVLKYLEFRDCDIRNECEREIKGKLLHLRAEYLLIRGDRKGLVDLTARSLNAFRLVFAGALALKRSLVPEKTLDLLESVAREYDLDEEFMTELNALARGEIRPDAVETDRLFDRYVEEMDKLSRAIDVYCSPEE